MFALAVLFGTTAAALAQRGDFGADSPISVVSTIIPNNTNPILISSKQSLVYSVEAFPNNSTHEQLRVDGGRS